MFLRRNRRTVDGETYEYWTLVRTIRTAKGPRQEVVASLGKTPGLDQRSRQGWDHIPDLLEGRCPSPRQSYQYELQMPQAWDTDGFSFAIRFSRTSTDGVSRTAYLDNVVLTQVPEPSTLALVGLGLAALSFWRFRPSK